MRIGKIAAKAIIECVKSVSYLSTYSVEPVTSERIQKYLSMSFEYVTDAIEAAILLKFIINDDSYKLTSEGQELCISTSEKLQILFKKQLLEFPPFTPLIRLLLDGNLFDNAVRKIITIYSIQGNEKEIIYSFKSWMRFAKIIGSKGNYIGVPIDISVPSDYLDELIMALNDDLKLRLFLENFFTTSMFSILPDRTIEFLLDAFRLHKLNPDSAIVELGKAIESYIRNLPSLLGIEHTFNSTSPLGGLISELARNSSLFPLDDKHITMLRGITQPRNIAAHEENDPTWDIKENSSLFTILFALSIIRSIHVMLFQQNKLF